MEDEIFENGKEALIQDLESLAEALEVPVEEKVTVQLLRA
jgi:hypothetical protein